MQKIELAQNKLKQFNQEEILSTLNSLEDDKKEELVNQILNINFEEIEELYKNVHIKPQEECYEIKPIEVTDKEKITDDEKEELKSIGLNIIKNNQYAVVTMAGRTGNSIRVARTKRNI